MIKPVLAIYGHVSMCALLTLFYFWQNTLQKVWGTLHQSLN